MNTERDTIEQRIAVRLHELEQCPSMDTNSRHRLRRLIAKDRAALAARALRSQVTTHEEDE